MKAINLRAKGKGRNSSPGELGDGKQTKEGVGRRCSMPRGGGGSWRLGMAGWNGGQAGCGWADWEEPGTFGLT